MFMSSKTLPKQSVANAFVIWRVPISMPIRKVDLLKNLEDDIERSAESEDFYFGVFSRRATPDRTLKFLVQRNLLSEKSGLISRNDRTKRYVARLDPKVAKLIDTLPVCDPLILLAGAGD
jgi:hypothetical protein